MWCTHNEDVQYVQNYVEFHFGLFALHVSVVTAESVLNFEYIVYTLVGGIKIREVNDLRLAFCIEQLYGHNLYC